MRALLIPIIVAAGLVLVGCATPFSSRSEAPAELFADALFGPPTEQVGAQEIFAMSDDMRRYARGEMSSLIRKHGLHGALIEGLYRAGRLKLEYESTVTRNAAQAFEARAGNCLSLVIMTAAFAKDLGLQVRYQSAYITEAWRLKGDLLLLNGHVNVTLGQPSKLTRRSSSPGADWIRHQTTIDFLPAEELQGLRTVEIPESLVVAMYMNNRAVEALVQGRLDDAYAWAREAVRAEPSFVAAQNTLGVVYLRRGALAQAGAVFSHALASEPDHTSLLANYAEVASREGRVDEAAQLRARLARLEPEPPLHYFNLGLAAMQREDFRAARDLFEKEAARGDASADVHFWLSLAHYRLGDIERAKRELTLASEASASRSERDLYASKLDWLRTRRAN
ncbi:MAG TPA: tetratricopeptide repeat protein [Burkholderiaceae bacterium]|nr:tetratricopeptide repeat protein [Burkholderiaceae bacterium]